MAYNVNPSYVLLTGSTISQYAIIVGGASNLLASVAPSSSGQIFTSTGPSSNPGWTTTTYPTTNPINTILYASGVNAMSALATANNGVLITSAAGVPSILADGVTGQVLTATTGSPPSWQNAVEHSDYTQSFILGGM